MVILLHIGPKVCSFKSGRERWIFKGDKGPSEGRVNRRPHVVQFYGMLKKITQGTIDNDG
jgi:hypothetical protein